MGICYTAIDWDEKKQINPPKSFASKSPGIYHPKNPFPNMVMMMNIKGYDFELYDDCGSAFEEFCTFKDISDEVYQEYIETFPWAKEEVYEQME